MVPLGQDTETHRLCQLSSLLCVQTSSGRFLQTEHVCRVNSVPHRLWTLQCEQACCPNWSDSSHSSCHYIICSSSKTLCIFLVFLLSSCSLALIISRPQVEDRISTTLVPAIDRFVLFVCFFFPLSYFSAQTILKSPFSLSHFMLFVFSRAGGVSFYRSRVPLSSSYTLSAAE